MHLPSSKSEPGHDLKKFLDVIAGLWVLSIVGARCNFLNLSYIAFVAAHFSDLQSRAQATSLPFYCVLGLLSAVIASTMGT
ncbi:hypothetical protein MKW98_006358 [Papaver atlanticum]|uniref:Reticulon domain-containing protein n=1 Tax=Papaver atlanticum TaxID=357466 RepID=A0AAD4X450_9MAGN|nr:hypothetical protein MKW98_006358 [Papaver atlanticum]